ncbi:hypothetical protein [Carp edema virus]|nr:hypothetical protein [Carp edema virus]
MNVQQIDNEQHRINSERFDQISEYLRTNVNLPVVDEIDFDQVIAQINNEVDRTNCIRKCHELYSLVKTGEFVKTKMYDYIYALSCNLFQYIENPDSDWTEGRLGVLLTTEHVKNWLKIRILVDDLPGIRLAFIDITKDQFRVCSYSKWCRTDMATCNYTTFVKDRLPFMHKTTTNLWIGLEAIAPVLERIEGGVRIHLSYSNITPKHLMSECITELSSPDSVKNVFLRWLKKDIPEPFRNAFLDCLTHLQKIREVIAPVNEELLTGTSTPFQILRPRITPGLKRSRSVENFMELSSSSSSDNIEEVNQVVESQPEFTTEEQVTEQVENQTSEQNVTQVDNTELDTTVKQMVDSMMETAAGNKDVFEFMIPDSVLKTIEELKEELIKLSLESDFVSVEIPEEVSSVDSVIDTEMVIVSSPNSSEVVETATEVQANSPTVSKDSIVIEIKDLDEMTQESTDSSQDSAQNSVQEDVKVGSSEESSDENSQDKVTFVSEASCVLKVNTPPTDNTRVVCKRTLDTSSDEEPTPVVVEKPKKMKKVVRKVKKTVIKKIYVLKPIKQ